MRDLRAALRNQPAVEHEYDQAPIHMPGFVQSYGVLVVAEQPSGRVRFVSENISTLFGRAPADVLDRPFVQLTDNERERTLLREKIRPDTILFPNPVRLTIGGKPCDAVFHRHAGVLMIEIEPALDDAESYDDLSLRATAELYEAPSIGDLCQRAVQVVRQVTGFDRVLLYRFDARYNGQVIAEARREGVDSFLGMFFPSGDITARARELYLRNFTRYIPEIAAPPCRLVGVVPGGGHADSAEPVDMSHANLRGVVPCHITYLGNMGVGASMSFSITVDGRLWGLFACHHYAPRHISFDRRVVCEQTAMMFIYQLASMTSSAAQMRRRRLAAETIGRNLTVGTTLARRLAAAGGEWRGGPDSDVAGTLVARALEAVQAEAGWLLPPDIAPAPAPADAAPSHGAQLLLDLLEADSAAIVRNGQVLRIGDAPSEMAIYAISAMFGRELPDLCRGPLQVFATDSLAAAVPAAAEVKDRAAGVLAAAISLHGPAYILWFRREQIVHATWAGNPNDEAMLRTSDGFNPRASFEAWKQDIRNLSRPWEIEDVQVADELAALVRNLGEAPAWPPMQAMQQAAPPPRPLVSVAPQSTDEPARRVIRIGRI